ncbi:MAG: polymer-forming cytoskeletal protein [Bacteroidales bacterium]|nr:polymer-forming cytoskeletal protein [Bacteroidales bacterium]
MLDNMTKKIPNLNPNAISRIAAGTVIIGGEIKTQCDIRFDGDYTGNITSQSRVIIGETAHLKGEIRCESLDVFGTLEGDVFVKDTMTIKSEASFTGHIQSSRLVIELGAKFEGDNHPYVENKA